MSESTADPPPQKQVHEENQESCDKPGTLGKLTPLWPYPLLVFEQKEKACDGSGVYGHCWHPPPPPSSSRAKMRKPVTDLVSAGIVDCLPLPPLHTDAPLLCQPSQNIIQERKKKKKSTEIPYLCVHPIKRIFSTYIYVHSLRIHSFPAHSLTKIHPQLSFCISVSGYKYQYHSKNYQIKNKKIFFIVLSNSEHISL